MYRVQQGVWGALRAPQVRVGVRISIRRDEICLDALHIKVILTIETSVIRHFNRYVNRMRLKPSAGWALLKYIQKISWLCGGWGLGGTHNVTL